jgi:hypothetical protein
MILEGIIVAQANDLNAITKREAVDFAYMLKMGRHVKAADLLRSIGSMELAVELQSQPIEEPDPTWLNLLCERLGISIRSPQQIEAERAQHCTTRKVNHFFERFIGILDRSPYLLINCDETHISSHKRFRVLSPAAQVPLKRARKKLPHFSAMCTVSGSGRRFRPTLLLPRVISLPEELRPFEEQAFFISTRNGWMTQRSFLIFVHFLLFELAQYRRELPIELTNQRFLMIVDGHSSRYTFEAINLLFAHDVDVLVLPSHCTHVLQPFDVSIASPLKTKLATFCQQLGLTISLEESGELNYTLAEPEWLADKRRTLFQAFLWAWDEAACQRNIASGFRSSGISPLDAQQAMRNPHTRRVLPNEGPDNDIGDRHELSCCLLTAPDLLLVLQNKPKRVFADEERIIDMYAQWANLICFPDPDGAFLAGPTQFLWAVTVHQAGHETFRCPRIMAHRWLQFDPVILWRTVSRIAADAPKLINCGSPLDCHIVSTYLRFIRVDHICIKTYRFSSQSARLNAWHPFLFGTIRVCIATVAASSGIETLEPIFTTYTDATPTVTVRLSRTNGDVLFFFKSDEDLMALRSRAAITPEVIG